MKVLYNGQEITESVPISSDIITPLGDSAYAVAEMLWVVLSDSCEISFRETSVILNKGVWCPNDMIQSDDVPYTCKAFAILGDDYEYYIDEKYIPDTIARKADLNNIDLSNFYSKSEIDNMEFITVDDIDNICGTTIVNAVGTDVKF